MTGPIRALRLPFLYERIFKRATGARLFSLGLDAGPFAVRAKSLADFPVEARCSVFQLRFDLRAIEGALFRPSLSSTVEIATIDDLERAGVEDLGGSVEALEADGVQWFDHPGLFDRIARAPEDPWRRATCDLRHSRKFFSLGSEGRERRMRQIQVMLDRCVVLDDILWRPTSSPGSAISVYDDAVWVEDWLPGLTHMSDCPIFFDMHESDAVQDLLDRLTKRKLTSIRELRERRLDYEGDRYRLGYHADVATVRCAVRQLAACVSRTIAAEGAAVAEAYWKLFSFPADGDAAMAQELLRSARPALANADDPKIASIGNRIGMRLRSLDATN